MQDTLHGRFVRVALVAVLLPLVVFGVAVLTLSEREIREDAQELHRTVLDSVVSGTTIYLNARRERMEQLVREPDLQSLQSERVLPQLSAVLTADPFFRALLVCSADGKVMAVRTRRTDDPLLNLREQGIDVQSGMTLSVILQQAGMIARNDLLLVQPLERFAEPGSHGGILIGVASLSGPDFQDILAALPVRPGEYIALVSVDGQILARHGASLPADAVGLQIPESVMNRNGEVATCTLSRGNNQDHLSISYSSLLTCWIAVGRTEARTFGRLHSLRAGFLLAALLGIVLAVATGMFAGRLLSGPVSRLTDALRRVRDGEFAHRVEIESSGELKEAAGALNDLAELLERRRLVGTIWEKLRREDGRP